MVLPEYFKYLDAKRKKTVMSECLPTRQHLHHVFNNIPHLYCSTNANEESLVAYIIGPSEPDLAPVLRFPGRRHREPSKLQAKRG